MKLTNLRFNFLTATIAAVLCATTAQSLAPIQSHNHFGASAHRARTTTTFVQYDDPYSDFRNARYSNAGLLNERDEIAKSLGELTGVAGDLARDLGVTLGQIVGAGLLTYHTRDEEREADFLGVRTLPKAGFDPQGMVTMFQKLQRIEEQNSDLLG